jgi:hypothetical protein
MPVSYIALRAWVFLLGVGYLVLDLLDAALGSQSGFVDAGTQRYWFLLTFVLRLAVLSYLLPYRWGISTSIFYVRVAISSVALARTIFMSSEFALGVHGSKHWSLWPVTAVIVLSEAIAIALLFWRRNPIWYYKW